MTKNPPAPRPSPFRMAAARHLFNYYEEEGDFGALTPTESPNAYPAIAGLAATLEAAAASFLTFEEGEPPGAFDDLACWVVGLRDDRSDELNTDPDPERTALVREAARLEMLRPGYPTAA